MKKTYLLLSSLLSVFSVTNAQIELKQGLTLNYITRDYSYVVRPELPKKEEKALAVKNAFNEKMINGGFDDLTTTSTISKYIKEHVKEDTIDLFMVDETKVESKNGKKLETVEERAWVYTPSKTIWVVQEIPRKTTFTGGESVIDMGPWELPAQPKVGDRPKMVYNCIYSFMEGKISGSRDIITGYTTQSYTKRDQGFVNGVYGKYVETGVKFTPIIKTISAEVLTKTTAALTYYNRANAEITGTTNFSLNGKTYTAFIVTCESWISQMSLTMAAESDDKLIEAEKQRIMDKTTKKISGNDYGFTVQNVIEYVVPELGGTVKSIVYENGYVRFITTLTEVK